MREPEEIETPPPGKSSERAWSNDREPYVRNVEVGGSSPLTSTKKPRSEGQGGFPAKPSFVGVSLRVFTCLYVSLRVIVKFRFMLDSVAPVPA